MRTDNKGLRAITTEKEQAELRATGTPPLRLQYLRGSAEMGRPYGMDSRLWNVLSPELPGYRYGPDSGMPTLGVEGLKKVGVIPGRFEQEEREDAV